MEHENRRSISRIGSVYYSVQLASLDPLEGHALILHILIGVPLIAYNRLRTNWPDRPVGA